MERKPGTLRPPLLFGLLGLGLAAAALTVAGPRLLRPTQANPSSLLNAVKSDPNTAKELCRQFNALNASGRSVYSPTGLGQVAKSQGVTTGDAEILVTYVVGLYCPDVK